MEYGKIVIKAYGTNRIVSQTIALPYSFLGLAYTKLMLSESKDIISNFGSIEMVPCKKEDFSIHNFMQYLKLEAGEIDSDEYQMSLE